MFCPTPDCDFYFRKEVLTDEKLARNDLLQPTKFQCPKCQHQICNVCVSEYHDGINCKQNQDGVQREADNVMFNAKDLEIQKCPWCKVPVQLKDGCNVVKCKCSNDFCFSCGAKEIFRHRCMNGCSLWDHQKPEKEILNKLKRPCTADEIRQFDVLLERFKQRTERERFLLQREYAINKDSQALRGPLNDIFKEVTMLDQEKTNLVR